MMHEHARTDDKIANAYSALCRMLDAVGGIRYSTVLEFIETEGDIYSRRAFSTVPDIYPTGVTKPMWKGAWFDQLYHRHQTYVADGAAAIARTYPDSEVVAQLGATLQANVPIVSDGVAVGLLNLSLGDGDSWDKLVPHLDACTEIVLGLMTARD
jgi:hypothetical protein